MRTSKWSAIAVRLSRDMARYTRRRKPSGSLAINPAYFHVKLCPRKPNEQGYSTPQLLWHRGPRC
jgi:hypothetical protein